jgi:Uma2 family endonuclease
METAQKMKPQRIYTHQDLELFPDDEFWEILEGVPYQMTPPSVKHQDISGEVFRQIANYLREKANPCRVYAAPFGIFLPNTRKRNNFVMPDLTVVCEKIDGDKYYGVPPMVIEIMSPSNKPSEAHKKFELYQNFGIREYWVIYPDTETITVFRLNQNNKYELSSTYEKEDESQDPKVKVGIFEDLWIDFSLVFNGEPEESSPGG